MQSLSKDLLDRAIEIQEDWIEDFEEKDQAEVRKVAEFAKRTTAGFIASRLSFESGSAAKLVQQLAKHSQKEVLERSLDEHYSIQLLEAVPKIVARTLRLSRVRADLTPSQETEKLLAEATRTYVFGFWNGCAALARAAVEQALKDRISPLLPLRKAKLCDLIDEAIQSKILDRHCSELASTVKKAGNRALHGELLRDTEAWDTLVAARGVLDHLFAKGDQQ